MFTFAIVGILALFGAEISRRWAGIGIWQAAPWNLVFLIAPIICVAAKEQLISSSLLNPIITVIATVAVVLLFLGGPAGVRLSATPLLLMSSVVGLLVGFLCFAPSPHGLLSAAPTFIGFIFVAAAVSRGRGSWRLGRLLSGMIFTLCVLSLVMLALDPVAATTNYSTLDLGFVDGRLSGTFFHPNALGPIAVISFALVLVFWTGLLRIAALSIAALVTVLTDQRSALLAMVLVLGITLMSRPTKRGVKAVVMPLVLAAVMVGAVTVGANVWSDFLDRREDSVLSRESIYALAFHLLPTALPFGLGPNGFYDSSLVAGFSTGAAHAHDSWLSMLLGGGYLGGGGFIGLTAWSIFRSIRCLPARPLVAASVSLSLVESPVYAGSNATLIGVAAATLLLLVAPAWLSSADVPAQGEAPHKEASVTNG